MIVVHKTLGDRFAKNIRRERERRKLGQIKMARLLGVSNALVSYWENGKRVPTLEMIGRVAKKLGKRDMMDMLKE